MIFAFIAQASGTGAGGIIGFLPFILILVVVYFLMMRPQVKKQKEHTAMLTSLGRGDDVVTAGGIHGKILQTNDKDGTLQVQIAKGIIVTVERTGIARKKVYGAAETNLPETKPSEPKSRRQESESHGRENTGSNQPVSAMVVSGARSLAEDKSTGFDGEDQGAKKARYRRSRRRKPASFQANKGPNAGGGTPNADGGGNTNANSGSPSPGTHDSPVE